MKKYASIMLYQFTCCVYNATAQMFWFLTSKLITITSTDNLLIMGELNAAGHDENADWWAVAYDPAYRWFNYKLTTSEWIIAGDSLGDISVIFLFSAAVGVILGDFPARRAAQLV